jgi:hypothetical protein
MASFCDVNIFCVKAFDDDFEVLLVQPKGFDDAIFPGSCSNQMSSSRRRVPPRTAKLCCLPVLIDFSHCMWGLPTRDIID